MTPTATPSSGVHLNTCSGAPTPLSTKERDQLDSFEAEIRAYAETETAYASAKSDRATGSLGTGLALVMIEDGRLFRETHGTFESYVEASCPFGPRRAYQLRDAARVVLALRKRGVMDRPVNEAQVRPLTSQHLTDDQRVEVWEAVLERHGGPDGASKKKVRAVVDELFPKVTSGDVATHTESDEAPAGTSEAEGSSPADAVPEANPWAWGDEAREAFERVPDVDREAVRDALTVAAETEEVTPETVLDARAAVAAERAEDGGRSGRLTVIGRAVDVTSRDRQRLEGGRTVVEDPDVLGDTDAGYVGGPDVKPSPLLAVIPVAICPEPLLDDLDGARDRLEVVVSVAELEEHGGPVENGVLDVAAVREASEDAGIVKRFNPTGSLVGWAKHTTNPLTGCSHACSRRFCYASDVALRFYPQGFAPTVHPARLDAFANTKLPDGSLDAWGRSVFLGSMGDLMNRSFPDWWIQAVVAEIAAHPKWNVFVLTKLADRLGDFEWPPNALVGVTVTREKDVRAAALGLGRVGGDARKWVSVEPFLGRIDAGPLLNVGATFFAVGGQSKTRWSGEKQPDPSWVRDLFQQAWSAGAHVYAKDNLDWRGHIPFPGTTPYGPVGGGADAAPRERPVSRRPVRPRGPASSVA